MGDRKRTLRKRRKTSRKGAAASGAALALGVLTAGGTAEAAVFNVTNLNDNGAGSLRQAILDANAAAGADTITFQAGLTGTITLTTGQLKLYDSVDVQGPGAAALTVSGNDASRVFYVYNSDYLLDVTISGLSITEGNAPVGGGVYVYNENLTLDDVVITENAATFDGGGLWADGFSMNLTIRDSTISGNTAGNNGGGIYVEDTGGPLLIQNTVISGNQAGADGGGVYFYDPDDSTTIEGCTISGNTAGNLGGGIYVYDTDGGTHTIRQTTISGNSALAGGGIYLYGPDDPFVIENSTISGNQATAGNGGGIYLYSFYASSLTLRHVTLASNSASGSGGGIHAEVTQPDIFNSIIGDNTATTDSDLSNGLDGGFELTSTLVESPGGANINDNGGNILNQDPQLGPLQNNGGATQTHLPAGASPAVNAGNNAESLATDQRGVARPVNVTSDMGAVEVNPGTIQLTVGAVNVNENAGTVTITATRTGGTDGAVSVSYTTAPGTATSPDDFAAAAGVLNWASGDGAPKSFQVTIVNDLLDEPDETFTVTISNPQGGAALGAITTEAVTILDDDVPVTAIPTMGDYGKMLFAILCALGGLQLLRRRRELAAPVLAVSLALGAAAAPAEAAGKPDAEVRVATLAQIEEHGDKVVVRLQDGTSYEVSRDQLKMVDLRRGQDGGSRAAAGQPVVLKVRRDRDGQIKRLKVQIVKSPAQAQAVANAEEKD
ncbi:MAG TPA: choice-of-anchor Q domain-containing protein [Thermoanaerobaculia bacterium]